MMANASHRDQETECMLISGDSHEKMLQIWYLWLNVLLSFLIDSWMYLTIHQYSSNIALNSNNLAKTKHILNWIKWKVENFQISYNPNWLPSFLIFQLFYKKKGLLLIFLIFFLCLPDKINLSFSFQLPYINFNRASNLTRHISLLRTIYLAYKWNV